jgi:hypothetical protein
MDIDEMAFFVWLVAEAAASIRSGLQLIQLALDQVLGMLRITGAKWFHSDRGTTFRDDDEVRPHQEVGLH